MENAKMNSLIAQYPLVKDLVALKETTWFNPGTTSLAEGLPYVGLTEQDVQDAHARLSRFAPYLAKAFPCLLYTSPSPRDKRQSRMPSSA